jgi:N-acetylmuramoyl-L-alanine amidase
MLPIAYYFLQVILCSGLMMGYYWLVLRNKRFHQYNRFYLLTVMVLSWIVPLIKIRWAHQTVGADPKMIRFLSVVADGNSEIEAKLAGSVYALNWDMVLMIVYLLISAVLLTGLIRALYKVFRLLQTHSCKTLGDVYLIMTQVKGTPFSFFRYIFWNDEIDIRSESGKQIFAHELTHAEQKHSLDKIMIQLMLVVGWCNPFFWLIKKEMEMIHEFIADKKAVGNGNAASLAQMLLKASYPQQSFALTHPFFFSPIKRRLQMLTNTQNPRFSYLRRLIVLPLLAVLVVLVAFRKKEDRANATISVSSVMENVVNDVISPKNDVKSATGITVINEAVLDKRYTVMIDPGHWGKGKYQGAIAPDGTTEAALTLRISRKIAELNTNKNIDIELVPTDDASMTPMDKVNIINRKQPDLLVSIHFNVISPAGTTAGKASIKEIRGIDMYVPADMHAEHYQKSEALANYLNDALKTMNEPMRGIKRRTAQGGITILDKVKTPAVLLELGFLSNPETLQHVKNDAYQTEMSEAILQGVNNYLSKPVQARLATGQSFRDTLTKQQHKDAITRLWWNDSLDKKITKELIVLDGKKISQEEMAKLDPSAIASITVLKDQLATNSYGDAGKDGVLVLHSKKEVAYDAYKYNENNRNNQHLFGYTIRQYPDSVLRIRNTGGTNPLVIIDGVRGEMSDVAPDDINSINVLKGKTGISKYGADGTNGVIEIETKEHKKKGEDANRLFTETQIPPAFPGGMKAWAKYLERNLDSKIVEKNGGPAGKYTVQVSFVVEKDGYIHDVKALTDPGYGSAAEAIRVISKGPKWKPAIQNGKEVTAMHKQNITFIVSEPVKKL